jgi:tetratricopeptide (TPR) repeat protein
VHTFVVFALLVGAGVDAPPMSEAELAARAAALRSADPQARLAAAQAIAAASPASMELLARRLTLPRVTTPDTFRKLFLGMWAQVPNWKGFDPMWIRQPEPPWTPPPRVKGQPRPKRPPPHDPETLDWLTALNQVDLEKVAPLDPAGMIPVEHPKPDHPRRPPPVAAPVEPPAPPPPPPTPAELADARAEALEVVALLRGIAGSKRMEAVDPIFAMAFELDGVFRDECGRQIRAMDSFAVPALIRFMHQHGPAALHLGKQRRYASYQLDRMDRARPMKAIATAPDDRVRAAIIHAYGEERALDAVEAILNQIDAPAHRVRKEARWAWLRYVIGRPPPPAPKRKRKLPGGREEEEEKPDYLTYREIALLALQKELTEIKGAPPDPNATAKELTDELFAHYDERHAAEWDQQFQAGRDFERRGDLKAATDEYGWILAHDPNYVRRGEMARAFARYGDELRAAGELARAVGYYREAVDLDPNGPEASYAGARVALCDGLAALDRGHAEPELFRRALRLEPSLREASSGLSQAEWLRVRRRGLRVAESVAAVAGLLLLLRALWRRSSPRPRAWYKL